MFVPPFNIAYSKLERRSMPTLKFTIKGVEFQFIGEQGEITAFINRFMYEGASLHEGQTKPQTLKDANTSISSSIQLPPRRIAKLTPETPTAEPFKLTDLPLPNIEAVINYIMQKPSYEHTLPELQKKFYGRVYKSRGNEQRMWHRTSRQLKMAREVIEARIGGKFKEESAGERNLKQYIFVPNQAVLITDEQRTS